MQVWQLEAGVEVTRISFLRLPFRPRQTGAISCLESEPRLTWRQIHVFEASGHLERAVGQRGQCPPEGVVKFATRQVRQVEEAHAMGHKAIAVFAVCQRSRI